MSKWKSIRYSVNRNRHMPKSCQSSSFVFILYHLFEEAEKQKSISSGQMMNDSFSLRPRWILKASASFKEKVKN